MRIGRQPAGDRVESAIIDNLYRARHNDAAVARASRFLAQFPGSPLAPSVRLLQLRLDIRLGNLAAARARLDALLADRRTLASARQSAERTVAAVLVAAAIFRIMSNDPKVDTRRQPATLVKVELPSTVGQQRSGIFERVLVRSLL